MKKYIEAEFSCNEYYLLASLLRDTYKIGDILQNGRTYLDSIPEEERAILLEQFQQFIDTASNIPSIQSLLNFGQNFDKLPNSEERGKYNEYMNNRVDRIAEAESDEKFAQIEGEDVLEAFKQLKATPFYNSILKKTLEHKEVLESNFKQYESKAEQTLKPILEGQPEKKAQILVRPPELYDNPDALGNKGQIMKSSAVYPKSFDTEDPNLKVVAMLHEIMHGYIPLPESEQFENKTQHSIYAIINHSLVELATNCELGMKICNVDSYFQIPMHDEILKKDWEDEEGIKQGFFIEQGISFPPEFEFESTTEYGKRRFRKKTETKKDELSNDKIRGIVYPYFLLFKNRQGKDPMKETIAEIERDSEAIKRIYGEEFYAWISNPEYLMGIQGQIKDVDSIVDLNDSIAREAFGIEKVRTAEKSPQFETTDIGRTVFTGKAAVPETKKLEAQSIVGQDMMQMTQEKTGEEQEN